MSKSEKRKEIYDFIHNSLVNKTVDKKEWNKIQKDISKMMKEYLAVKEDIQIVYKEKIVYKDKIVYKNNPIKQEKKGYWDV